MGNLGSVGYKHKQQLVHFSIFKYVIYVGRQCEVTGTKVVVFKDAKSLGRVIFSHAIFRHEHALFSGKMSKIVVDS